MRRLVAQMALLMALGVFGQGLPRVAWAEVFLFIDADGVSHFTNVPNDPRYRRHMTAAPSRRSISPRQRAHILSTIERTAERFRLETALIKAVVKAESDFNPRAISSAGALGLMQLMPATAIRWEVNNPFDPAENIEGGVRYLRHLIDLFEGNLILALAAYHAGERRVQHYQDIPPIPETQTYVKRVLRFYQKYLETQPHRSAVYRLTLPSGEVVYSDTSDPTLDNRRSSSEEVVFR